MEKIIAEINEFLKRQTWCDFSIIDLKGNLRVGGRTGFSEKNDIIIIFEDVFYIQCLYEWKTDTSKDAFFIPNKMDEREINLNYSIEYDYYLCKIIAEDISSPMYVSCKNIKIEFPD